VGVIHIIPALRRLRLEDQVFEQDLPQLHTQFKTSLGSIETLYQKKKKKE
jgi:hypothetical protein